MTFSEAIEAAMQAKGWDRADLARATGRSYQYISDLLKGKRRWHESILLEVCSALDVKVEIVPVGGGAA